ncbi:ABC transporter substrate-binding protein [Roseomonas populi]|uniref:ABC transporter substrate-binding protein n=1 Tax=Roseomonas populi TaxID=3121582 RepID=A0ABT1XBR3_9PROT|nr:ABC transporter substrate-binding protein [Roseomonas pecuniae]MCR0984439.1 ABC transporter substrate-binding protein [Roseomonas pecuniae]
MDRRSLLLSGLSLAGLPLARPALAQTRPLQKVRIAVSTTVLNVGYPMLTLPLTLGYWKEEGYDVELMPVGASLQSIQQMVGGNAEFGEVNASVIVQANAKNDLPVRIAMGNGVIDWSVGVNADGPITSAKDLKGKTIGVFSLATGGIAYLNSYLRSNGLDPAKDVEMIPLGLGAPPVEALRSGRVQGLLYWASAIASFENAGLKLRKLVGDDWRQYPDYTLAVMQGTAEKNPDMVVGIARGMAKATVYALANPDCARQLHWDRYPATKPSGADAATLARWDLNTQQAQLDSLKDAFALNGGKLWGNADPAAYDRLVRFMLETKQIDKPVTAASMMVRIPDYFEKINRFDTATVQAAAAACKS